MPTTVRIAIFSTDPEAGVEDNVDSVTQAQNTRHERWSIFGGQDPVRMYWPLNGEMNLFLQLWLPQPATAESTFRITFPGATSWLGWECIVPAIGRINLMLRKPATTDIIELVADPFSIEADAIYF